MFSPIFQVLSFTLLDFYFNVNRNESKDSFYNYDSRYWIIKQTYTLKNSHILMQNKFGVLYMYNFI